MLVDFKMAFFIFELSYLELSVLLSIFPKILNFSSTITIFESSKSPHHFNQG